MNSSSYPTNTPGTPELRRRGHYCSSGPVEWTCRREFAPGTSGESPWAGRLVEQPKRVRGGGLSEGAASSPSLRTKRLLPDHPTERTTRHRGGSDPGGEVPSRRLVVWCLHLDTGVRRDLA